MHWGDHLRRDEQGRLVMGDPRGCPHCGSVRQFVSEDGNAVVYFTPRTCCAPRAADRGKHIERVRREQERGQD